MRPFGTDDDDIELSYILDRHVQTSFALVDCAAEQRPTLHEDQFVNGATRLPHTNMSAKLTDHPPKLHAHVTLKHPDDGNVWSVEEADADGEGARLKRTEKKRQMQF